MIRVVAIRKAVAAGVGGAIAMEIFSRVGALLGLKTIDFIAELSSVAFRGAASSWSASWSCGRVNSRPNDRSTVTVLV